MSQLLLAGAKPLFGFLAGMVLVKAPVRDGHRDMEFELQLEAPRAELRVQPAPAPREGAKREDPKIEIAPAPLPKP